MNAKRFRVEGYDSFSHEGFHVGDYETKEEAVEVATKKGGTMTLMYVYDTEGKRIFTAGSF